MAISACATALRMDPEILSGQDMAMIFIFILESMVLKVVSI
jgi:hypothetical protein